MERIQNDVPSLGELSTIAAENNPNRLAFADDSGQSVTWSEFEERSKRAATAFTGHVAQGDRVAILADSAVDTTVAWNGALKAGAVVSYLHTQAAPDTVAYSIDELRPKVLVVGESYSEFVGERVWDHVDSDPHVVVLGEGTRSYEEPYGDFVGDAEPTTPDVLTEEDDIAAIVWTSGTTGDPKGWCHTHRSIMLKALAISEDQTGVSLTSSSTSFMAWYGHVVSAMVAGASVVYLPDWDPEAWAEMVEEYGATKAGMVPTMWRAVLDLDLEEYDLSSLREISFVGEKMSRTTLNRLREEVCENVSNNYASTELMVSTMPVEEMEGDRIESVGKPWHGTRVRIIEPGGAPSDRKPANEVGEIIIKAPDCPVWAWGNTEKAHSEFTDGWWYSGDMGYKDEDGYLFLEGRKDFMIKSKGVKVFPAPIEERLNDHAGVEEAVVVGLDDEEYGQQVTAVVRPADDDLTAEDLDQWCLDSDTVARFERPREYVFTDIEIPRTPSQKLDRRTLIERLGEDRTLPGEA